MRPARTLAPLLTVVAALVLWGAPLRGETMDLLGIDAPENTQGGAALTYGLSDNVTSPDTGSITRVVGPQGTTAANVTAIYRNGQAYLPVDGLLPIFGTTAEPQGNGIVVLRRADGGQMILDLSQVVAVIFFDQVVPVDGAPTVYGGTPYLSNSTAGNLMGYSSSMDRASGTMTLQPRDMAAAASDPSWTSYSNGWQETLSRAGLLDYANSLDQAAGVGATAAAPTAAAAPQGQAFTHIWATSEEPQKIASAGLHGDWRLRADDLALALPSRKALGKKVVIRYPKTGKTAVGTVVDVGPWNVDDPYWLKSGGRPSAEASRDQYGRSTNKAGIDLGFGLWAALGVSRSTAYGGNHSDFVDWWFSAGQ